MSNGSPELSLSEAASRFMANLLPVERAASQPEVYKFVRWFGAGRSLAGLTAAEVANYAERLSLSDTDYMRKLELVRAFLVYGKKSGWSKINLSIHLKGRKGKNRLASLPRQSPCETVFLTRRGHSELEAKLADLRDRRAEAIDEVRKAAADKDFRENAPLDAARELRGQLEGQIVELEETLKSAAIIDEKARPGLKVGVGDRVIVCALGSGEELCYTLVSSTEADPAGGKISSSSPIGRAVIGRSEGETVEVVAPAGRLSYQIKRVER